jgi:hypothetical protein
MALHFPFGKKLSSSHSSESQNHLLFPPDPVEIFTRAHMSLLPVFWIAAMASAKTTISLIGVYSTHIFVCQERLTYCLAQSSPSVANGKSRGERSYDLTQNISDDAYRVKMRE